MVSFPRERAIAVSAFAFLMLPCLLLPAFCLAARSDAVQSLAEEQDNLTRLEDIHRRVADRSSKSKTYITAPEAALLHAQTPALASAQLETYVSQLAMAQQANLLSTGVQNTFHADSPDVVHIQTTIEIRYDALQKFLYKLEAGTPYVFIDTLVLQPQLTSIAHGGHVQAMKATLNLRALWSQSPI